MYRIIHMAREPRTTGYQRLFWKTSAAPNYARGRPMPRLLGEFYV
jgi:hypothetical protein